MGGRRRRRIGPAYRLIEAGRREARLRECRKEVVQLLPRGKDGRQGLHGRREVLRQESHPEGIRGEDEGAGENRPGTRPGCGKERGTGVDGDGGQGVSLPVRLPSLPGGVPASVPAWAPTPTGMPTGTTRRRGWKPGTTGGRVLRTCIRSSPGAGEEGR